MAPTADGDCVMHYYGIQVPAGVNIPEGVIVESYYTDKVEALKLLKKIKPARMKQFTTILEAVDFSEAHPLTSLPQPETAVSSAGGCESLPYSSVRLQELVKLKQAVEKGDLVKIRELVESNPRYLIASGDTPTILQERFRYNALHAAALKGQVAAAEMILNYLSDPTLFSRLYPTDSAECRHKRMVFLLDLYLNTPDKGCNETPLHFAAKFGHSETVKLLANEVTMDIQRVNKEGNTAAQIACNRTSNTAKQEIINALDGQCYIPLYRSDDGASMPFIGEPWDPVSSAAPTRSIAPGDDKERDLTCMTSPLRCVHQHSLPAISLPSTSGHRLAPGVSVKAVVGPMSPKKASEFKRNWSSPRRTPLKRDSNAAGSYVDIVRTDPDKGLEFVGRTLASDMRVPWVEYWDFLGCAIDIRQTAGLNKLEQHLLSLENNIQQPQQSATDMCSGDQETPEAHTSGNQETGDLDTTDEQLASMFSTLSIHSPSSPLYNRHHGEISTQPATDDIPAIPTKASRNGGHLLSPLPEADAQQRTILELMVPAIIPLVDRIRTFWPFGRGGFSPKPPSKTPQSFQDISAIDREIVHCNELPSMGNSSSIGSTPQTSQVSAPEAKYKPGRRVFLKGAQPCKVDTDVLKALQSVDVDELTYPAVHNWLNNVTAFSAQDRSSWQSPLALRHRKRLQWLREKEHPIRRLVLD